MWGVEVKAGVDVAVTGRMNVWTGLSQQVGKDDYLSTGLSVGVKYAFRAGGSRQQGPV